jgi:hypothetical protein
MPEDRNKPLPLGLYEQVIDRDIERSVAALFEESREAEVEELDVGDSHQSLADHLRRVIGEILDAMTGEERLDRQLTLCNQLIWVLYAAPDERVLPPPPRRLLSVWPKDHGRLRPERPDTPLGLGCVLAGTRLDPSLVSQLRKELASTDRVDILCSFIKRDIGVRSKAGYRCQIE